MKLVLWNTKQKEKKMKRTIKRMRIPLPEKVEKAHSPKTAYKRQNQKKNVRDFLEEAEDQYNDEFLLDLERFNRND